MDSHISPVDLQKAYRLINHGPTVLVSARDADVDNVMAAACGANGSQHRNSFQNYGGKAS